MKLAARHPTNMLGAFMAETGVVGTTEASAMRSAGPITRPSGN